MNMEQISNRLAKMIVHENDDLAHFKKQYRPSGTVRKSRNYKVEWFALTEDI